ncbi:hypothetical protein DPEC_G00298110 [Dallia pectoralis]|uniref:Uncharacterized protein n=1 Tax=Dallia pectoralis TaxID=75939 RepID=A0ACC2FFV4_DALPE|nr:hypothetical protein DPEC_G00298110 [Dallia pectoralis]
MKGNFLPASLLTVWTMAVFIGCQTEPKIKVSEGPNEITLSCENGGFDGNENIKEKKLKYKDEHSREYVCSKDSKKSTIYVKFRTCDNCIEVDTAAAVGMLMGELVATILIGVAVYQIASKPRGTLASGKKASSQMVLLQNEANAQSDTGGHYQRLNKRRQESSEYSTLQERR